MIKYFRLQMTVRNGVSISVGDCPDVEEVDHEYSIDGTHDFGLADHFERWADCGGYGVDDLKLKPFRLGDFLFTPLRLVRIKEISQIRDRDISLGSIGESVFGKVERYAGHGSLQDAIDCYRSPKVFP